MAPPRQRRLSARGGIDRPVQRRPPWPQLPPRTGPQPTRTAVDGRPLCGGETGPAVQRLLPAYRAWYAERLRTSYAPQWRRLVSGG
jgi:hypothetical protein